MVEHKYTDRERSWSQAQSYLRCAKAFQLERLDGAWSRPDGWRPMGTAVHAAAEAFEKSGRTMTPDEALQVAQDSYRAGINAFLEETPNADAWSKSGPYSGSVDIPRRFSQLADHLGRYLAFVGDARPVIWTTPDGEPGIELAFVVEFAGVKVRGFIDQVWQTDGGILPVDLKTGTSKSDPLQLSVYHEALKKLYPDENVLDTGAFLTTSNKARKAKLTYEVVSGKLEELNAMFRLADDGIRAGEFEPSPGEACRRCGVSTSCPVGLKFIGGQR